MSIHITRRMLAFVGLASLVGAATVVAQNPPAAGRGSPPPATADQRYRYRLLGVYDDATGEPIEGVEVSDVLSGMSSLTTKTGTVSLIFLPDGGSFVRLRKVGYEMQTFTVAIAPTEMSPVTVVLRKAVELPTVVVKDSAPRYLSPRLQGAVDRINSHSGGYFIDETEMRKHDNSTLANTITSKMAGLTTGLGPHGETYLVSSRNPCLSAGLAGSCKQPNCYVAVYLDGVKVFDPRNSSASSRPDFARMSPMDYAIAEFYPGGSTIPAEYSGTNTSCGVLLLWSREK